MVAFLALTFSLLLSSQYKYQHAMTLMKQNITPIHRAVFTPQFMAANGVKNAFMIYPTSGSIKTSPAKFPIHEEARLPWIMYRIYAPDASNVLPPIKMEK